MSKQLDVFFDVLLAAAIRQLIKMFSAWFAELSDEDKVAKIEAALNDQPTV